MKIEVQKISPDDTLFETVKKIRHTVFVIEQEVPEEEEFDEFESSSAHFLALVDDLPAGASRWRETSEGFKLQRFAVLKEHRKKGVGSALVQAVLDDLPSSAEKPIYLHAQFDAMPLYQKFGFEKVGEAFQECDIWHYKMVRNRF
ncbi:MAG: GNAT family N-acetyltransferase [Bacteroidota bacterium]